MKPLRIFISSPGDVHEERERARDVVQSLRRRYARKFTLHPVVWEELPLEPDMSFQQGIDLFLKDPGVDVAIFILWSRLGSPLGATIRKEDGSSYRSGTEREYDLMIQARAQTRRDEGSARPRMIVYTRSDDSSFDARLRGKTTAEKKEMLEQKELVESFMKETFNDFETGDNISAYHPFNGPVSFTQRLRTHLQSILDELAGDLNEVVWDVNKQGPPFLGLDAFQPQHADVFFGREEEILEARNALKEKAATGCAFLLLSGASGSGKSSLARAGILPEILAHEPDEQAEVWKSLIVTPAQLGENAILSLLKLLAAPDLLPELEAQVPSLEKHAEDLAKDAKGFLSYSFPKAIEAAKSRLGGQVHFLLVIDQLEEVFTKETFGKDSRTAFLRFIEALASSGNFWFIATVRSDFYQQVQGEPELVRMKEGRGLLDVLPPQPDAIHRLIEEPARLAGLSFEVKDGQSLSNRILRDTAQHAELLPLLEFVLLELFNRLNEKNELTHQAYDLLGGVEGALRRKADSTYEELTGESQASLGKVLQQLVTLGDDSGKHGELDKPLRLRAPLSTFPEESPAGQLVAAFISARLFTSEKTNLTQEATVTVAHESLLRVWPRAIQWKEENLEFLRTRSRVAARMKDGSPLLQGDPLYDAASRSLLTHGSGFTAEQLQWIQKSISEAERKSKRLKRLKQVAVVSLCALTLIASAGGIMALSLWREAREQTEAAETATKNAEEILYLSNVTHAAEAIGRRKNLEASRYLSKAPVSQRNWEWRLLGKTIGFAPIELDPNHLDILKSDALAETGIHEAAVDLLNQKFESNRVQTSKSIIIQAFAGGRGGGGLSIGKAPWQPTLVDYETASYGSVDSFWISPDESVALFLSSPIRSEVHRLHPENKDESEESFLYLVPIPKDRHFVSTEWISGSAEQLLPTDEDYHHEPSFGEDILLRSYPNGLLLAGSEDDAGEWLFGFPDEDSSLTIETISESEALEPEVIAASLSLPPDSRANALKWLNEVDEISTAKNDEYSSPKRIHLDVNWSDPKLPILSVSRDGIITVTTLENRETQYEISIQDQTAKSIWYTMTSVLGPGAYDGGGRFLASGEQLLICPFQSDLAAIINLRGEPLQVLGEKERNANEWWFFGANDWSARPGYSLWETSPKGTYSWLYSVDSPSASSNFGIAENATGRVIFQSLGSGAYRAGWTNDEQILALHDRKRQEIVLKRNLAGNSLRRVSTTSSQQSDPILREIPAATGRILVGENLLRQSDFRTLVKFYSPIVVPRQGDWAAFKEKSETSEEYSGFRSEQFMPFTLVTGISDPAPANLSDKVRILQLSLLAKDLEDSYVTYTDGEWSALEIAEEPVLQPEWDSLELFLRCSENRLDELITELLVRKKEAHQSSSFEANFSQIAHLAFDKPSLDSATERELWTEFENSSIGEDSGGWQKEHSLLLAAAAKQNLEPTKHRELWDSLSQIFFAFEVSRIPEGARLWEDQIRRDRASMMDTGNSNYNMNNNPVANLILAAEAWDRGEKQAAWAYLFPLIHPDLQPTQRNGFRMPALSLTQEAQATGQAPFWLSLLPSPLANSVQEAAGAAEGHPSTHEDLLTLARTLTSERTTRLAGQMLASAVQASSLVSYELRLEAAVLAGDHGGELAFEPREKDEASRFYQILHIRSRLTWPLDRMLELKDDANIGEEFLTWAQNQPDWGDEEIEIRAEICGHFLKGDSEAALKHFAQLLELNPELQWPESCPFEGIFDTEAKVLEFLRRDWHAAQLTDLPLGPKYDLHDLLSRPVDEPGYTTEMIPRILAEFPDLPPAVLRIFISSMLAGGPPFVDRDAASECLSRLPEEPASQFFEALIETVKGNRKEALQMLVEVYGKDPRLGFLSIDEYYWRSLVWPSFQTPEPIIETVHQAYANWPAILYPDIPSLMSHARDEAEKGENDKAWKLMAEAEQRGAESYRIHELRSQLFESRGDLPKALESLITAADEAREVGALPEALDLHRTAAELAIQMGDEQMEVTLGQLDEALQIDPENSENLRLRYHLVSQREAPEEARTALKALVNSREPQTGEILQFAWEETLAGRSQDALPALILALTISRDREVMEPCAWMYLCNGLPRNALRCFVALASSGSPDALKRDEGLLCGLALATWQLGHQEDSLKFFAALCDQFPAHLDEEEQLPENLNSLEDHLKEIRKAASDASHASQESDE